MPARGATPHHHWKPQDELACRRVIEQTAYPVRCSILQGGMIALSDCTWSNSSSHATTRQIWPLDPETLMAAALHKTGQRDFSDRSFIEPLNHLLRSYAEEADLNAFGRAAARYDVMRGLTNMLLLDMAEMRCPEIRRRSIDRPVFITGFPRSASTFLHKLLSLDPSIAVPRTWELIYPYPSWDRVGAAVRKLQVEAELWFFSALSPNLAKLHGMGADEPQECIDITAQVFQSTRYNDQFRVSGYQHWLEKYGHDQAYRFHRRFLQHLDARVSHQRWVLKAPDHLFALGSLLRTYPDAQLIFLHRDPLQVVASAAKLTEAVQRPFTRCRDRFEIGHRVSSGLIRAANCMVDAAGHQRNILNLSYHEVVAHPMETVARIYERCGLGLSREAEGRMRRWLVRPRSRSRGGRPYSLKEFGLNGEILDRKFARYRDAFGALYRRAS